MELFARIAKEIFSEAGVDPAEHPEKFRKVVEILNMKMAMLIPMGLSYERVRIFDEQKRALVEDLKELATPSFPRNE